MGEAYLFNYEDGTPKSLDDSLSLTRLLSRDYRTLIKRLRDSYQEIIGLL